MPNVSVTGGARTIQAIETRYGGCHFRSRLEARWAVFFDALGIKWEYEPEGYRLSDGTCYLPDFRIQKDNVRAMHRTIMAWVNPSTGKPRGIANLDTVSFDQEATWLQEPGDVLTKMEEFVVEPIVGILVEVKRSSPPPGSFNKILQLGQDLGESVWCVAGPPDLNMTDASSAESCILAWSPERAFQVLMHYHRDPDLKSKDARLAGLAPLKMKASVRGVSLFEDAVRAALSERFGT